MKPTRRKPFILTRFAALALFMLSAAQAPTFAAGPADAVNDPKPAQGLISKVGGGVGRFDFTKVCQDGSLNCTTAVDQTATPAASAWACTKDNVTHLIWAQEVFASTGTRDVSSVISSKITSTNASKRCGYKSGWRLPTRRELLSIVLYDDNNTAIDAAYFPNTPGTNYWSSDIYTASKAGGWIVSFEDGVPYDGYQAVTYSVRLVRSGK